MIRRKGELGSAGIDRGWPHQVALPAKACAGKHYDAIRDFSATLSLCPRGHFFYRDDEGFNVFCFAVHAHAEAFHRRFGGEILDPGDRPKWPGSRRR